MRPWMTLARASSTPTKSCGSLDRRGEGYSLLYVGTAHLALGDAARALEVFTEERNGSKRINSRLGEGYALDGMGAAQLRLGNASRALEFYEQVQKEIEDEIGAMQTYAGL